MANLRADNLCGNGFVSANDGTVWSNYITGGTLTNYPATYGFDGNVSNFVYAAVDGTMVWTPPNGGIKAGLIEVYVYAGNTHPIVEVNGKGTGAVVGSATPAQQGNWVDVTELVDGHLKTITCYGQEISGVDRQSGFAAVRINGEILTDSLVGTKGGRNAIDGSVYFEENSYLEVTNPSDLALGDGDFTIETWVNFTKIDTYQCIIDFRAAGNGAFPFIVRDTDGDLYYYVNSGVLINNVPARANNCWHHIAVVRNSGTTKFYLNGVEEGSASDSTTYVASNNPTIGASTAFSNDLFGYLSNLRIVKGTAVYTAAFTPPTEKLTAIEGTVLLCCQDMDDPTAEATGKEIVGWRKCYHGKRYSNIATNGDLETGDTTGWTNSGCSTFEVSTDVVHSGTYSLHCVSDGNGDYAYTTVSVKSHLRYKVSAYINCVGPAGTSAKAKMKLDHSSAGASQLYESQTANAGAGWQYVEWIGLAHSSTMYITFNESSSNNVNDWYIDDLKVELWYPEEGENILPNPTFMDGATGWSFSSTPSGEYTISSNRLNVADTSRTNDAYATVQLFSTSYAEGRYKVTIDYVLTSDDFDIGIGNNRIFGVAGGGTFSGEGNSASVTYEIEAGSSNSSLRLVANQHCVGYFNNITLSRVPEPKRNNPLPPVGVDAGVTFAGETKHNTQSYMYFPTGDTSQRGRGRGVFAGGETPSKVNSIEYVNIQSMGTAKDFGDLTTTTGDLKGLGSSTRGVFRVDNNPTSRNVLEYITFATTSNATDFGDLNIAVQQRPGASNQTRGIFSGGLYPGSSVHNDMDYITIATTGNAADFGNLSVARGDTSALASPTRMVVAGGWTPGPTYSDVVDYVTIATTGNAADFGDLNTGKRGGTAVANSTRGVFGPGRESSVSNVLDYITIATTGTVTDFGDALLARGGAGSASNSIRGLFAGGYTPSKVNGIEFITIATTGNGADFGDMTFVSQYGGGCSDSHGGLS